jgi:hypothetical protein
VKAVRLVGLGRLESPAFDGDSVDEHGSPQGAGLGQDRLQGAGVVAVDGSQVDEAELGEEICTGLIRDGGVGAAILQGVQVVGECSRGGGVGRWLAPMLFSASQAMPPVMAPSPMTATTDLSWWPCSSWALARPSA